MSKWSTVLKYGKRAATASVNSMGNAVIHPQRTLMGLGKATKTAVVGGGMGYLAWENIVNDKPVIRAAADVLVGEETVDKGMDAVGQATKKVEGMVEKAGETLDGVKSSVSDVTGSWNGIGKFAKEILGGNGLNTLGSFFSNIGKGNVSGLSILGLVASSLLIFGRFGWLGKIAGALMGMMLIGNNSERSMNEQRSINNSPDTEQPRGMKR